jgi:uncharacterized protein
MSRSNPPRSSIVAGLRQKRSSNDAADQSAPVPRKRSLKRRLAIQVASVSLWLHIYVSMFGLAVVLFFSVTGITLNHPDWFFEDAERSVDAGGGLDPKWLHLDVPRSAPDSEADPSREVAKLEVVEHLRKQHGVRGALSDFRVDDSECTVSFKGPGYAADAVIDRESGRYKLTQQYHGLIAVINDLHKGRDTGPVWSLLIDISAVLLTIISLTGLILLFYLKLRRVKGLVVGLVGVGALVALWWLGVP